MWNRGNVPVVDELFAANHVFRAAGSPPLDREGHKEMIAHVQSAFLDLPYPDFWPSEKEKCSPIARLALASRLDTRGERYIRSDAMSVLHGHARDPILLQSVIGLSRRVGSLLRQHMSASTDGSRYSASYII